MDFLVGLLVWVFVIIPIGAAILRALVMLIVGIVAALSGRDR